MERSTNGTCVCVCARARFEIDLPLLWFTPNIPLPSWFIGDNVMQWCGFEVGTVGTIYCHLPWWSRICLLCVMADCFGRFVYCPIHGKKDHVGLLNLIFEHY